MRFASVFCVAMAAAALSAGQARADLCASTTRCVEHSGESCIMRFNGKTGHPIYGHMTSNHCQTTQRFVRNGQCVFRVLAVQKSFLGCR